MTINYIELAQAHVEHLYPFIVYHKPPMSELPPGTILGTWAYSIPHKMRFILDRERELAAGTMPSDVSRAWIKDTITLPIKLRRDQVEAKSFPLPNMARVGNYGECCYVDIKGAYLSFLRMGYDLEYLPGHYLASNFTKIPPEIEANKMCYSIAVSMSNSRQTNIEIMGREGTFNHKGFNIYSNPCLYRLACDTLASIASEAVRAFGERIVYANTDGFIIDAAHANNLIDCIASWGFSSRVKYQGETVIYGVGAWKVGKHTTRRNDSNAKSFCSPMPEKMQSVWLKKHVSRMNKYTANH